MGPMIASRSHTTLAVMNDKIYITGGCNGKDTLAQAERYDPTMNKWESITPMQSKRLQNNTSCFNINST